MANQQERAELHKTIWKIVSYIESQTARLDKSIEKAEHQIELLQELKQSVITEVVTGKRKVN